MRVDVAELKRLAQKATPGPWRLAGRLGFAHLVDVPEHPVLLCYGAPPPGVKATGNQLGMENAAYVAAANPQAILALIERLETLEAESNG